MIQQTSLVSYQDTKISMGTRGQQVLDHIRKVGVTYNRRIAQALRLPINTITPRVLELRQAGLVRFAGHGVDERTNKRVMLWQAGVKSHKRK